MSHSAPDSTLIPLLTFVVVVVVVVGALVVVVVVTGALTVAVEPSLACAIPLPFAACAVVGRTGGALNGTAGLAGGFDAVRFLQRFFERWQRDFLARGFEAMVATGALMLVTTWCGAKPPSDQPDAMPSGTERRMLSDAAVL